MKTGRPKQILKIAGKEIKTDYVDMITVYTGGAKRLNSLARKYNYKSRTQMLKEWEVNGDLICEIIKEKGVRIIK